MLQKLPIYLHQLQNFICCGSDSTNITKKSLIDREKNPENHLELGTFEDLDEMNVRKKKKKKKKNLNLFFEWI